MKGAAYLATGLGLILVGCEATPGSSGTPEPEAIASPAPSETLLVGALTGTLVYSSETAGNEDIYLLRLDGSQPIRLTDGPEKEFDPDLSPDGTTIAYRRNPTEGRDDADIWVMSLDGTDKRNLTNDATVSNWAPA